MHTIRCMCLVPVVLAWVGYVWVGGLRDPDQEYTLHVRTGKRARIDAR